MSKAEFKQTIPLHGMRKQNGSFVWENVNVNEGANSIFSRHYPQLNIIMRKYCINTPLRMACFLGNAIQETQWMGKTEEGYIYKRRNALTNAWESYNIWYYPWYGRGFLQLTNPINYFTFRGRQYPQAMRNSLVTAYQRLEGNSRLRDNDTSLHVERYPGLTPEIISWRDELKSGVFEPADSAGFYWCKSGMAKHADKAHVLERQSIATNKGSNVYYRSTAFWQASAIVNLPSKLNDTYSQRLNGFDARCCAYGSALAILTEMKFPDSKGQFTMENPESNQLRRK
ncbi:hypothetical protein [Serratia aquatilis]|uniref:Uncharacterized protein n=1 Tax=Serratia aquatilis TaxID=1737515 RepID=A0ABV6E7D5_9GAMM